MCHCALLSCSGFSGVFFWHFGSSVASRLAGKEQHQSGECGGNYLNGHLLCNCFDIFILFDAIVLLVHSGAV